MAFLAFSFLKTLCQLIDPLCISGFWIVNGVNNTILSVEWLRDPMVKDRGQSGVVGVIIVTIIVPYAFSTNDEILRC